MAGWFALSAAFAASGLMGTLPEIAVPGLIWGLTLAAAVTVYRWRNARRALSRMPLALAFGLHAVRAPVGLAFLWLGARGALDPTFVAIAGYGDIAAGIGAVGAGALWQWWSYRSAARWVVLAWNIFALADILTVFVTAQRVLFFGGGLAAMQGFLRFPMPMIPTFLVPLVLLTHAWIFARVAPVRGGSPAIR